MGTYTVGMISIVIVSTLALIYVLRKNNLLNLNLVAAIAVSSIAICFGVPFVFSKFNQLGLSLIISILITILIYITVILVMTVAISLIITDEKAKELWGKATDNKFVLTLQRAAIKAVDVISGKHIMSSTDNIKETNNSSADFVETSTYFASEQVENIIEKSVDTEQIIDKMGIENVNEDKSNILGKYESKIDYYDEEDNIVNDSISGETWTLPSKQSIDNIYCVSDSQNIDDKKTLNVNDCIDEAFRLKGIGDLEGAILHYMYALDKKPEKDAVFWIVLDTCVLYKELGQVGLAREILESYVTSYGDMMSVTVRTEIERNLSIN